MTALLDTVRLLVMAAGATAAAFTAEHPVASLTIVAASVASMIGLYEATH